MYKTLVMLNIQCRINQTGLK